MVERRAAYVYRDRCRMLGGLNCLEGKISNLWNINCISAGCRPEFYPSIFSRVCFLWCTKISFTPPCDWMESRIGPGDSYFSTIPFTPFVVEYKDQTRLASKTIASHDVNIIIDP